MLAAYIKPILSSKGWGCSTHRQTRASL